MAVTKSGSSEVSPPAITEPSALTAVADRASQPAGAPCNGSIPEGVHLTALQKAGHHNNVSCDLSLVQERLVDYEWGDNSRLWKPPRHSTESIPGFRCIRHLLDRSLSHESLGATTCRAISNYGGSRVRLVRTVCERRPRSMSGWCFESLSHGAKYGHAADECHAQVSMGGTSLRRSVCADRRSDPVNLFAAELRGRVLLLPLFRGILSQRRVPMRRLFVCCASRGALQSCGRRELGGRSGSRRSNHARRHDRFSGWVLCQ